MPDDGHRESPRTGPSARPGGEHHAGVHPHVPSGAEHRHSWQRAGGGPAAVGAILLGLSAWLEYFVLGPGAPGAVFVAFAVLFGASIVLFVVAAFALAHYGIVGRSAGGRFALRAYATSWAISQAAYLAYKYVLPPATTNFYLVLLSTAFLGLTFVFGLVAAVFVALGRVAWGPARWSLFVAIGVAVVVAAVMARSDSLFLSSAMETLAAAAQLFVAVTYYFARGRDPWIGV